MGSQRDRVHGSGYIGFGLYHSNANMYELLLYEVQASCTFLLQILWVLKLVSAMFQVVDHYAAHLSFRHDKVDASMLFFVSHSSLITNQWSLNQGWIDSLTCSSDIYKLLMAQHFWLSFSPSDLFPSSNSFQYAQQEHLMHRLSFLRFSVMVFQIE